MFNFNSGPIFLTTFSPFYIHKQHTLHERSKEQLDAKRSWLHVTADKYLKQLFKNRNSFRQLYLGCSTLFCIKICTKLIVSVGKLYAEHYINYVDFNINLKS